MAEPQDSIMDMVNNVEPFYNDKLAMFDRWVEDGDLWDERTGHQEAESLAAHFAEAIESMPYVEGKYTKGDIGGAADEMLEEFDEHRDEAIKDAIEAVTGTPKPEDLELSPGDIEHAEKYEDVATDIGVNELKKLIPASPEKIRKALERGDKHLNTIPLRKWDAAAAQIPEEGFNFSLSEKVSALKHVAKWHYA